MELKWDVDNIEYHKRIKMALDQVDVDKPEVKRTDEMSFWEHIEQLRWHLMRSAIAIVVMMLIAFSYSNWIFTHIIFGPRDENFITYRVFCHLSQMFHIDGLCMKPPHFQMIANELGELFFTDMQVAFILGLILAFPYVLWEFWRFIKPGLFEKEAKSARGIVLICSSLFLTGVLFGYFIVAPCAISFLAGYKLGDIVMTPKISDFIGYMIMFTLPIGLVFELPVVIYFLTKIGIVSAKFLRTYRRHMIVVILIVAGVITPSPDVFSQMMVGVPLYILFEVSIVVSARVQKNRELELKNQS